MTTTSTIQTHEEVIERSRKMGQKTNDAFYDYLSLTAPTIPGSENNLNASMSLEASIDSIKCFSHPQPFSSYATIEGHYNQKNQPANHLSFFVKFFSPVEGRDESWGGYYGQSDPEKQALTYELFGGVNGLPKILLKKIESDGTGYFILENVGKTPLQTEVTDTEDAVKKRNLLVSSIMEIKDFQVKAQERYIGLDNNRENADKLAKVFSQRTMGERFVDYLRGLGLKLSSGERVRAIESYESLFEGIDDHRIAINHGDINLMNIIKDDLGRYHLIDPKLKKGNRFHDLANLISCPLKISHKDWVLFTEAFELGPGQVEVIQRRRGNGKIRTKAIKRTPQGTEWCIVPPETRASMLYDVHRLVLHYSLRRLSKDADFKRKFPEATKELWLSDPLFSGSDEIMEEKINAATAHLRDYMTRVEPLKKSSLDYVESIIRKGIAIYQKAKAK